MKKIILAVLMLTALMFPALAADVNRAKKIEADIPETFVRSWTGLYLGGTIGYGYATLDNVPAPAALGFKDWVFGVNGGYDLQVNKYWIVGAFADYEFAKSQDWDQGWWTLGGRVGYLLAQDTMLYGLGGYSQVWKHSDITALMAGAGLEQRLGLGWSTKLEYRHHFVDTGTPFDVSADSVRLGVSYKFGAN